MNHTIYIKSVTRINVHGEEETLEFNLGSNVLIGPSNSGKTVWLMMIDYLLGDPSSVEEALNKDDRDGNLLFEIYDELRSVIEINDVEYLLERKWKQKGLKSKTIIDGQAYDASEFSKFILEKLNISSLKFPKGNPYQDGSWIELTFRILFRHIYRQERFWNDLADRQPESEQHAALCQFLGLAGDIFSPMSSELIEKRKELVRVQAQKEQFQEVFDQITKRLLPVGEKGMIFVTADALLDRISELKTQLNVLIEQRQDTIAKGVNAVLDADQKSESFEIQLTENRAKIIHELESIADLRQKNEDKINRFKYLLKTIDVEYGKLSRAKTAGDLLADIKITHCPACDQTVQHVENDEQTCFLCHQHLNHIESEERVDFELYQLENEKKELSELLNRINTEHKELHRKYEQLDSSLIIIDQQLIPLKRKLSGLIQSQVSTLDLRRGKLEEQIQGYNRILQTLNYRDELSKKIDLLTSQIQTQVNGLPKYNDIIDYEKATDDLADGMMEYINKISIDKPERWGFAENNSRIRMYLNDKRFNFRVGRTNWSSMGAKPKTYFLLAYHYGLLKLYFQQSYNYPGFLIIDFPPVLAEGTISSSENYLIKPFIELCNSGSNSLQVIIAGEAFGQLESVNTIVLKGAYK